MNESRQQTLLRLLLRQCSIAMMPGHCAIGYPTSSSIFWKAKHLLPQTPITIRHRFPYIHRTRELASHSEAVEFGNDNGAFRCSMDRTGSRRFASSWKQRLDSIG
jgi:hypothetical protein